MKILWHSFDQSLFIFQYDGIVTANKIRKAEILLITNKDKIGNHF